MVRFPSPAGVVWVAGGELRLIAVTSVLFVITKKCNAMRELVSDCSGFRVPKITAFWLGLAICVRSAEPGLRHELRKSPARSRYGCNAGDGVFYFVIEAVLRKIEDVWRASRLQIRPPPPLLAYFGGPDRSSNSITREYGSCYLDKLWHFWNLCAMCGTTTN